MTRAEEARLLYSLLTAAEEEGRLLNDELLRKWRMLKARFSPDHCERQQPALARLFGEIDRTDVLVGTWIQARWRRARAGGTRPGVRRTRLRTDTRSPAPPG